jgi:hypothetical protein
MHGVAARITTRRCPGGAGAGDAGRLRESAVGRLWVSGAACFGAGTESFCRMRRSFSAWRRRKPHSRRRSCSRRNSSRSAEYLGEAVLSRMAESSARLNNDACLIQKFSRTPHSKCKSLIMPNSALLKSLAKNLGNCFQNRTSVTPPHPGIPGFSSGGVAGRARSQQSPRGRHPLCNRPSRADRDHHPAGSSGGPPRQEAPTGTPGHRERRSLSGGAGAWVRWLGRGRTSTGL